MRTLHSRIASVAACACALVALVACGSKDGGGAMSPVPIPIGGPGASGPGLEPPGRETSMEPNTAGAAGTGAGQGSDAGANTDAGADAGAPIPASFELRAVAAHGSAGLDWDVVDGATGYRIHAANAPGVVPGAAGVTVTETSEPVHVLRGLVDGTSAYYVVTAMLPSGETASNEVEVTPGGEWVLEELGSGLFEDVTTGMPVARVPMERRAQVLLFAEGYTAGDLAVLHDLAEHAGDRSNDVDRWVDQVFAIEPYSAFREAFAVWYLPRESNAAPGGDTAFAIPVDASGSYPGVGNIASDGETAMRAWAAIAEHPMPPTQFYSGYSQRALNHVAYFLMFDPNRGRASFSGRSSSIEDTATGNRMSAAFGIPFAHEFTHAFAQLSDEYVETDRMVSGMSSETSNVVATNTCASLPWQHLLYGSEINPDIDQLVGAFGTDGYGYHSELVCLMNGTHDNATVFGGSGLLRTDDRMCNFCREMTSFRVYERTGAIASPGAFDTWKADYRMPFYERHGFFVPSVVPQTNDVDAPGSGMPYFHACVP